MSLSETFDEEAILEAEISELDAKIWAEKLDELDLRIDGDPYFWSATTNESTGKPLLNCNTSTVEQLEKLRNALEIFGVIPNAQIGRTTQNRQSASWRLTLDSIIEGRTNALITGTKGSESEHVKILTESLGKMKARRP